MAKEENFVRFRNDGDDFHVLWTARRALRLLDPSSDLVGVSVEGVYEHELDGNELTAGLLVVDTAEYYGALDLRQARTVAYYQLKYSTQDPDKPWPVSGLAETLEGFAKRFRQAVTELGKTDTLAKIRFRFVTNRAISDNVLAAFQALENGTPPKALGTAVQNARKALLKKTGLKVAEFSEFAGLVEFWAGERARHDLANILARDARRVSLDSEATMRMKTLVIDHTTSDAMNDKVIDRDKVLLAFRVTPGELFPAPAKIETKDFAFPRAQEVEIAAAVVKASWPVVIQAAGGGGKTVLAQHLGRYMPTGSEVVLFDGFAAGDYRNISSYRHSPARGVTQIVNELAARGLCDILIPQSSASDQDYLREFRSRLEQAGATVRARAPDALVLVIVDAADNLGMAAEEAQETNFAEALLQEAPPQTCRIVALARPHRVERYLRPRPEVLPPIDLRPFTVEESALLLRRRFPEATDDQAAQFHHFTDSNPRVQANALGLAPDLAALCDSLGPTVETAETLVAEQLATAFAKVQREHGADGEFTKLGAALAVLPPPVPLRTLALASGLPEDAIRSFAADFAGGRPILIRDEAVQFRDEPTETWFREKFAPTKEQWAEIADRLAPCAETDTYVATVLPIVLHQAGRYEQLMALSLGDAPPDSLPPVERRAIVLQRASYGLKAAALRGRMTDTVKLLVRVAEEVAADSRQVGFLHDHADLVGALAGSDVVADHVFRRRPWRDDGMAFIACAAMLSANPVGKAEAGQYLRLAMQWLEEWAADRRAHPDDHTKRKFEPEDVALYAEAIGRVNGPAKMVFFLSRWNGLMPLFAGGIMARRLLDREQRDTLIAVLAEETTPFLLRLAITRELIARCLAPPVSAVQRLVDELLTDPAPIELPDEMDSRQIFPSIAAVAESALFASISKADIFKLLARYSVPHVRAYTYYDPSGRKDSLLRMAALSAVLEGRDLRLDDVVPDRLRDKWQEKRERGREEREFIANYKDMISWHLLRIKAIAGLVSAFDIPAMPTNWGYDQDGPSRFTAKQDVARLRMEALLWANAELVAVDDWVRTEQTSLSNTTWTTLARLAASRPTGAEAAFRCAARAYDLTVGEHLDARQTADQLMEIARALLPCGTASASYYVREALDHVGRLGSDIHNRLTTLLTLAGQAGSDVREAYRLARAAELLHAYNDHKFPWSDVVDTMVHLDMPSALAAVARWDDRGVEPVRFALPALAIAAFEQQSLSPESLVALHAFGGYWGGKNLIEQVFTKLSDKRRRQVALDILVSDHELDPSEEGMGIRELHAQARRYQLFNPRLDAVAATNVQASGERSENNWRGLEKEQEPPDWGDVFDSLDLGTPQGINDGLERWKKQRQGSTFDEFYKAMRGRVTPEARANHVSALALSDLEYGSWVIDALEGCQSDWMHDPQVRLALRSGIRTFLDQRAEDVIPNPYLDGDDLARCVALSGDSRTDLVRRMTSAISTRVHFVTDSSLFHFAGVLAEETLKPPEALDALTYSLDRLENVIRENDGDGPWRPELSPPTTYDDALASFLYGMLGSPEAETRWRAAHSVVRLGRLEQASVISALVRMLPSHQLPAFTGNNLPFYYLHARLWLLIAFARLAVETPSAVAPHMSVLLHWALGSDEPHVLIRHFAAQTVLAICARGEGTIDDNLDAQLRAVNASAMEPLSADQRHYTGYDLHYGRDKYLIPYDFDKNWIAPLGNAFGLPPDEIFRRMEVWVYNRWRIDPPKDYREPRAGRLKRHNYGQDFLPPFDDYRFYVCWHAILCTAGALVAELPPALYYSENGWVEWQSRLALTRSDGRWLADRRDPVPLDICPEMGDVGYGAEEREVWVSSVSSEDLDAALGVRRQPVEGLVVEGSWREGKFGNKQRVCIQSALVAPSTSMALLRALQTAANPYAYHLPSIGEDVDDVPDIFRVTPFAHKRDNESGLDQHDVFAGSVSWPPAEPSHTVRAAFNLTADEDRRQWRWGDTIVMNSEAWGARVDERRGDEARRGHRLTVTVAFLQEVLGSLERDLIIEVEIEREYEDQPGRWDHEQIGNRPYNRIYLFRGATGRLHTLHGSVPLWSKTD